jgi:hypothetical protein
MSQEDKVKRAEEYTKRNSDILAHIRKLMREYEHNFTCAKNLYKKSQSGYIPDEYKYGYGSISINFD